MINAQAQRIVTVINAVPRDLAVVIKQIGEKAPAGTAAPAAESKPEVKAEEAAPAPAERRAPAEPARLLKQPKRPRPAATEAS